MGTCLHVHSNFRVYIFASLIIVLVAAESHPPRYRNPQAKTILTWNDYFGQKYFGASLGNASFLNCEVSNCELWDRLDSEEDLPVEEYDAIVFHGIDTGNSSKEDLPLRRRPNQRYIFVLFESPVMRPHIYNRSNYFNWTATYRHGSDISTPFIAIEETKMSTPKETSISCPKWKQPTFRDMTHIPEYVSKKTKLVVWFVSNNWAQSKRNIYVEELSKHIEVDIYGSGRNLTCDYGDDNCDLILDTTYKFYLAFENSLCKEYVTEKFRRAMNHYAVPVVYGGGDYNILAPSHSYIDVRDFRGPKELAKYLHYLDNNPKEYRKYFWWKKFYSLVPHPDDIMWCDICKKLHDVEMPNRVYPDMDRWWSYSGACETVQDYFGSRSKPEHWLSLMKFW